MTSDGTIDDALAKCRRLVARLERDATEMTSAARADSSLADGAQLVEDALATARRVVQDLEAPADASATLSS